MNNETNITKIVESFFQDFEKIKQELIVKFTNKESSEHPDIVIIKSEEKQSISIDQVKNLRSWAYTRPFTLDRKLIIIENADLLTKEAQNSILKITEEPPEFTHIYLLVENYKNLLPTIISRSEFISKKGERVITQKANEFMNLSITEKFKFIDNLSKLDKKQVQLFIDDMIFYTREKKNYSNVEKLISFKNSLDSNVSKKLVLDNLIMLFE